VKRERAVRHLEGKPTVRQIYAVARLLCAQADEQWPETREQASELIERLREGEEPDRALAER
jgi:hypothetical protein